MQEPDSLQQPLMVDPEPTQEVMSEEIDLEMPHYSVVVTRGDWFQVSVRRPYTNTTGQVHSQLLSGADGRRVCAMEMRPDMPHYLATHFHTDYVLYICIHNPMNDCPFIEMQELIKKANRTVEIIVLLPPLEHFETALSAPAPLRLHANKETKFVATYSDWASWLTLMTSGVFARITIVLPYFFAASLQQSKAWECAVRAADASVLA